jgi:hypothetical protein
MIAESGRSAVEPRVSGEAFFLPSDDAREKVIIPRGDLPPQAQRVLAAGGSEQIVSYMLDCREVGGRILGSHPALGSEPS